MGEQLAFEKTVDLQALANIRTPESWLKMVDEVLSHYFHGDEEIPAFMYTNIAENALEKLNKQMPFEREWQPIYKLFMELAVVNRLSLRFTKSCSVDEHLLENFFIKDFNPSKTSSMKSPVLPAFLQRIRFLIKCSSSSGNCCLNRKASSTGK